MTALSLPPAARPTRLRSARSRWPGLTPFGVISALVALGIAFLAAYPLARVVARLFWVDGSLTVAPLREAFGESDLLELLGNTAVVVAGSSLLALVGGAVLAWLIERTDARMGVFSDVMPLIPFLVPAVAGAVGWVLMFSERAGLGNVLLRAALSKVGVHLTDGPFDIYSWYGLIFVYSLYTVPYTYMMVAAGLRNLDSSLEEQARMCGSSLWRTMRTVALPGVAPSIGGAALLAVWHGFALYSVPQIIGTGAKIDILSVRIVRLLSFTYPPETSKAVGLSLFVVVTVGLAWYWQRRILTRARHATVGGKGAHRVRVELGVWRWPARLMILGYGVLALALPATGLVLVALNGYWTADIDWSGLNLDSFRALFEDNLTVAAARNSGRLAVVGATIGIVCAAIIALYVKRLGRSIGGKALDATVKVPAVFSSIILAVGFILAFSGPPFNLHGSLTILLLGYLALYFPQASVAADAAAAQVARELPEASSMSGAGPARTFRKVSLPIMIPGLVAGWTLLFARMIGDLTMSAVLSGPGNPVVGMRVLEIFENSSWSVLAALALLITLVTCAVVVVVMVALRGRGGLGVHARTRGAVGG